MHLPLLPSGAIEVRFVPGVRRDGHHDASRRAAPGPAAPLDRPDLGGDRLVEDAEVPLRGVQAFFADRRPGDYVHPPRPETLADVSPRLLSHSVVLSA